MEAGVRIDGDTTGVPGGHCPGSLDAGLAARTAFRWGCGAGCGGLSQESRMGRELSALNLGGRRTAFGGVGGYHRRDAAARLGVSPCPSDVSSVVTRTQLMAPFPSCPHFISKYGGETSQ